MLVLCHLVLPSFSPTVPFNIISVLFLFYVRRGGDWDRVSLCNPKWPWAHYVVSLVLNFRSSSLSFMIAIILSVNCHTESFKKNKTKQRIGKYLLNFYCLLLKKNKHKIYIHYRFQKLYNSEKFPPTKSLVFLLYSSYIYVILFMHFSLNAQHFPFFFFLSS